MGTPAAVIARINTEVNKALAMPDVVEKMAAQGVSVAGGASDAFASFVQADYERWGRVVKDAGIKLD